MFHIATEQYSPVLHVVIHMHSSDQLAKIMAEVSSTSSQGLLLHEWSDKDSKESLNDEERITERKHGKEN